jgi:hypothetical protein
VGAFDLAGGRERLAQLVDAGAEARAPCKFVAKAETIRGFAPVVPALRLTLA